MIDGNAENTENTDCGMATDPCINLKCGCLIARIINVVGENETRYSFLIDLLMKSLGAKNPSNGKIDQLQGWFTFSESIKTGVTVEMLETFLKTIKCIDSNE